MNRTLLDLLRQHFPDSRIPDNTDNLAVGSFAEWDSMAHFNFLLLIEEHYGVRFSVEEMAELKSLQNIADTLASLGAK
jgi:acyl carrier protein